MGLLKPAIQPAISALLALLLLASPLEAQTYILVVPTDEVRRYLASQWEPGGDEKAFCGTFTIGIAHDGEPLLLLNAVERTNERDATPVSVVFSCPRGTVPLHTHPNHVCGPSLKDLRHLKRTNALFGITICDRYAYAGYSSKLVWPKP